MRRPVTRAGTILTYKVVLSGRPGPQVAAFAQVPELAGLQHPVRLAPDQHAPAAQLCLVKMVGLERDLVVAMRRDQRTGPGPQHDGAGHQDVVHRQDHQPGSGGEGEPAEPAGREQPVAVRQVAAAPKQPGDTPASAAGEPRIPLSRVSKAWRARVPH